MSEPIVAGFYPDPTICRVGEDYYLAQSSFEYFPGAPIWHSRDLLQWQQIGHILTRRSQFARGDGGPSGGLYAGTLRHHDWRFFYVTTNISDFEAGQLVVSAIDPAGPWSEPVFVPEATGIDPDLAWDGDGQCFLTWAALSFSDGEGGVLQARLDLATGRLLDQPYPVWQGSGMASAEGPHLYAVDGWWYLVLAEGGTERGHAVTVARSRQPLGPFEGCPANPILSHRSSGHPVQNTGHADLVSCPDGSWAAVYLGVRPRGSIPGFHVVGRETFLAGVDWKEGWLSFDERRFPAVPADHGFVDSFDRAELDQRWVVPGGDPAELVKLDPSGGLWIHSPDDRTEGSAGRGSVLCARVRDLRWSAVASFDSPGRFLLRMDDRHVYGLTRTADRVQATARIGDLEVVVAERTVPRGRVVLRIDAVDPGSPPVPVGHGGPDDIVLSVFDRDGPHELARLDGRYLSSEVASGFTGRMLALGATTGPARVTSVAYRPSRPLVDSDLDHAPVTTKEFL